MSLPASTLRLADGRQLAYQLSGAERGPLLLMNQGTPGCRLVTERVAGPARERGLRVLSLDRPGFGLSSPDYPRRFDRFTADVAALLAHLGVDRFAVAGVSGGGPHALALAAGLPQQTAAAAILCGAGPGEPADLWQGSSNAQAIRLMRRAPWLFRAFSRLSAWQAARALASEAGSRKLLATMLARVPAADREALADPQAQADLLVSVREALRQGGAGVTEESLLTGGDWRDLLAQVAVPVRWWHGQDDLNVPLPVAQAAVAAIEDAQLQVVPGGHAAWLPHIGAVLDWLAEALQR